MAYDIGPRIGIDGESEFRRSLTNIKENIKTLGSQMDVVTSSFLNNEKSMDDLVAQQRILEKQIDATKEKIKLQAEAAGAAAGKFGSNATETQKWERALANSQTELNKLKSQLSAVEKEMDDFGKETEDVEESLEDAGKAGLSFGDILKANVLSDAIMSGIKALGSAVADMARSFVDFAKSGVETASDLEEVQNVVDTTFGEKGAESVDAFAKKAASAFGMSELSAKQFTGTMGAMLKSMGLSEDAVLDMSTDLAGLAGDMASFYNLDPEEAFAKLRSGISGETEPLKQLGINMSVANLEAYALAQGIETAYKDMTQAEQATLRYNYLMQATADAQGDFAKTSDSYANQQRIMQLNIENLGASIGTKLLPYLTGFTSALNGLLSGETDVKTFVGELSGMVLQIADGIITNLPVIMEAGGQILTNLFAGLQEIGPKAIDVAVEVLDTLVTGLLNGLPMLLETGAGLLVSLVTGIAERLPELIPTAVSVITQLVETLTSPEVLVSLIDAGLVLIVSLAEGLVKAIPELIQAIPTIIKNLVSSLVQSAPKILAAGVQLIVNLGAGLIQAIPELVANIPKVIAAIVGGLIEGISKIKDIGKNIVNGLWEGIKSMGTWIKEKVGGFFDGIVGGVKNLLGIHSPSRVFAGIGGYMAEGLGEGFGSEMRGVQRDIDRSMQSLIPDVSGNVSITGKSDSAVGFGSGMGYKDMVAAFRDALNGMAVSMNGRKVGTIVTNQQNTNTRATGVPVTA